MPKTESRPVKTIRIGADLDVRYRREEDATWYAIGWRVMKGRWRRCDALSRRTRRILGPFAWISDAAMQSKREVLHD